VRKILSLALCSDREAPRDVIVRLANDSEEEVASPVLKQSPVLTEDDISEIIARNDAPWAKAAVAARPDQQKAIAKPVPAPVSASPPMPVPAPIPISTPKPTPAVKETPEARAARLLAEGKLNDEIVANALAAGERSFVTAALALRAGVSPRIAERMVLGKSAKGLVALAWKGKFPMRFALEVQQRLALIPHSALIYARDGVDYPLSPKEMNWHLGLFTD
jgi:uncharacterized protein (DUF2336 family)